MERGRRQPVQINLTQYRKMAEKKIIIDAESNPLGRMASYAAKQALLGNSVVVVNSEKAIIIGNKKDILDGFLHRLTLGHGVQKGPLHSKMPADICRRAIRGMIRRKRLTGSEAYRRVKCFEGVPLEYESSEKISFPKKPVKFVTIEKLSSWIKLK